MNISRRDFLKGTAAGALSLAATSLLSQGVAFADGEKAADEAVNYYKTSAGLNPQDYDFRDPDSDLSAIFSPWKFGGLSLNHRMVKSAAGSDTQKGSEEEAVEYYANFAKGGVEMVWVEDFLKFHDNFPSARATAIEDSHVKAVVDGVHKAGGYIGYQLSCMGRSFSGFDAATAAMYESAFAEHLTREEVKLVQEDFINGANLKLIYFIIKDTKW